jgi:hypothetical protein
MTALTHILHGLSRCAPQQQTRQPKDQAIIAFEVHNGIGIA